MKVVRQNKKGIASLIVVMIVSVILSLVVIGFVRIAVREQRQSTDNELSARALYAAEAGLQDAVKKLKLQGATPIDEENCYAGQVSPADELDIEYTCLLIDAGPVPDFQASIPANGTVNIPLTAEPFNRISIEWHDPSQDGSVSSPSRPSDTLPREDNWSFPAMIRATFIGYPESGITRDEIDSALILFNPSVAASSEVPNLSGTAGRNYVGIVNASCSDSGDPDYLCSSGLMTTNSGSDYVLRLTSLYRDTHVRVSLYLGGNPVPFVEGQAIVDVTGRAGDVYRRVEARIKTKGSFAELLPDYAIISATDICKNAVIPATEEEGWLGLYNPNSCD